MDWQGVTSDPNKVDDTKLERDIKVLWAMILFLPRPRGKPRAFFMSELNEYFDWLAVLINTKRERQGMAKQNEKSNNWLGFVDVKMTDSEKETYGSWDVHEDDLYVLMADAVASGHKLSMTFNKQNETFVCSFTGNVGTGKHEGYTLSAFAPDWYNALRVLLFKHSILLDARWETAAERPHEGIG